MNNSEATVVTFRNITENGVFPLVLPVIFFLGFLFSKYFWICPVGLLLYYMWLKEKYYFLKIEKNDFVIDYFLKPNGAINYSMEDIVLVKIDYSSKFGGKSEDYFTIKTSNGRIYTIGLKRTKEDIGKLKSVYRIINEPDKVQVIASDEIRTQIIS